MIPQHSRRLSRRFDFDFFAKVASSAFQGIAARDPRHGPLERTYAFYALPGGRDGGHDKRVVEIFYGQRPFESVQEVVRREHSLPALRHRLLTERGATLLYERGDNGVVLCTLYPACSENYRRREEAILLAIIRGTHVLTGTPTLERLRWTPSAGQKSERLKRESRRFQLPLPIRGIIQATVSIFFYTKSMLYSHLLAAVGPV